jgi:hypothetical protein
MKASTVIIIQRKTKMLDYPVYIRLTTESEKPFFENRSSAEAVIGALINAQQQGWLRLHGFVLLPSALEMVASVIRQGVPGVVAQIQAETIPLLSILLPNSGWVWSRQYSHTMLMTQRALDARLNILLLSPVANGIVDAAEQYPYSSANPRYSASVASYAGFQKTPEVETISDDESGESEVISGTLPETVASDNPGVV